MNLTKFNSIWPNVGFFFALLITTYAFINWNFQNQLALLFLLNFAVLMYHEFEEYSFPGGFKHFFNYETIFALPIPQDDAPIDDSLILIINLGLWPVYLGSYLVSDAFPWLGLGLVIFNFSNIFGHLILFQIKKKGYNPGFLTALLLMVPITSYVLYYSLFAEFTGLDYFLAVGIGIFTSLSLPVIGIQRRKHYMQNF
jgi:hypothetical protein